MTRTDRPRHTHGAAKARRVLTIRIISILGAPRFSPYRSWLNPHLVAGGTSLEDDDDDENENEVSGDRRLRGAGQNVRKRPSDQCAKSCPRIQRPALPLAYPAGSTAFND